jgi:formylglycine-generating enzyme
VSRCVPTIAIAIAVGLATVGCARVGDPLPQWVVHVGTDAPLPGFGDRVRIDLVDAQGQVCPACTRVFDLRQGQALPLSFGVVPTGAPGPRLRVRLFRAEATAATGEPIDPIIDAFGALPALGDAPLDVRVVLGMDCFGKPASIDTQTSCDPATGQDVPGFTFPAGGAEGLPSAGSWGLGDEPCPSEAPPDMVCVPGGVFLLGSRTFAPYGPDFDPVPEQLVHLSPYFMDRDELTVAAFRPLVGPHVPEPLAHSEAQPFCAYTPASGASEAASVNCLDRATAEAACTAEGKRLPTEAEWEFAAGGRTIESPYPWPLQNPTNVQLCAQAVLARGELLDDTASRVCILIEPDLPVGPQIGGSPSDVSADGLRNLGGNLSEWAADDFARYSDAPCWGPDLALRDNPQCTTGGDVGVIRGGNWTTIPYDSHVYFRQGAGRGLQAPFIGVRCARNGS